jgi:hypothetical protein
LAFFILAAGLASSTKVEDKAEANQRIHQDEEREAAELTQLDMSLNQIERTRLKLLK